nr:G-protein coupled receptor 157 [Mirounga angustirostris]
MPPPVPPTELVPSERAVVLLSCALSALGSGLLVATHALWPDLRSPARRLLLFLSLADLLSAASYFYGVLQDFAGPSWDCVLQGALSTFANTSSFFWTVAIALYLYLSIVRAARQPRTGRLLWAFHVVRVVSAHVPRQSGGRRDDADGEVHLPGASDAGALAEVGTCALGSGAGMRRGAPDTRAVSRVLDPRGEMRGTQRTEGGTAARLAHTCSPCPAQHEALSEYRPILSEAHRPQHHASVADKKLILIPLIFICLRVWSTVRFVLTLCGSPAVQWPVLVVLHGIGNTFQGGANCIMFVLCTQAVRTRLFSVCCSSQPCAESPAGPPKAPAAPSQDGRTAGVQTHPR